MRANGREEDFSPTSKDFCAPIHAGAVMPALLTLRSLGLYLGEAERMGPGILSHICCIHSPGLQQAFLSLWEQAWCSRCWPPIASRGQHRAPFALNFLGVSEVTFCLGRHTLPTLRDRPGSSERHHLCFPRRVLQTGQPLGAFCLSGEEGEESIPGDHRHSCCGAVIGQTRPKETSLSLV